MQDTISCPACKTRLVLPPGVRDIVAQCPRCETRFPSHPVAAEPPPVWPTRSSSQTEAPAEPDSPPFDTTPTAPTEGSGGWGILKWGWLVIFFAIIRLMSSGGDVRQDQTTSDQDGQRRLQDHANRMDDRADAFAKQMKALEAAETQEFRPLFDALCREFREGNGGRLASYFAADRMAENILLVKMFDPPTKREFVGKLNRTLPEYLEQHAPEMAWSSLEIQAVGRPADGEATIATRLVNAGGDTRKVRWWLVLRLGRWQVFDVEDLRTGKKLSLSAGFPDGGP